MIIALLTGCGEDGDLENIDNNTGNSTEQPENLLAYFPLNLGMYYDFMGEGMDGNLATDVER